jgi:hypothetical protein
VRLEDDGVASHDGRRHLPGEERRRVVPRDDPDHHAVGYRPDEELLVRLVRGEHGAHLGAFEGGVVLEEARDRVADLAAGLGDRLALLRDDEAGEILLAGADRGGYRLQHRPALGAALASPLALGAPGCLERPFGVPLVGFWNRGDYRFVSRVDHWPRLVRAHPGAADVHSGLPAQNGSDVHAVSFQSVRLRVR